MKSSMQDPPIIAAIPWRAIVFGHDSTTLASHRRAQHLRYVPPGMMSDPIWLLDQAATQLAAGGREGTVIVRYAPLSEWGGDNRPPQDQMRELITKCRGGGWKCTDAALEHGSGWVTFRRDGAPAVVHLGVLDAIDPDKCPLFALTDEPAAIADQLAKYDAATGVSWRSTAGVAACAMVHDWYEHRPIAKGAKRSLPRWLLRDWPTNDAGTPGDVIWDRPMTETERKRPYVHVFDIRAQYLAGALVAELGWDAPEPVGACAFDPTRPGIWKIVATQRLLTNGFQYNDKIHARMLPPLLNPNRITSTGACWVSTPMLAFLHEMGFSPNVLDAYLSSHQARMLRPWAERLRNALAMHGRPAGHDKDCVCNPCRLTRSLKHTYSDGIGMMDRPGGTLYRPDWAETVRDLGRVNQLRKIIGAAKEYGRHPFRINRDAAYFASDDPAPDTLGRMIGQVDPKTGKPDLRIGKYKHERTIPMAEYLAEVKAAAARRKARLG